MDPHENQGAADLRKARQIESEDGGKLSQSAASFVQPMQQYSNIKCPEEN